MSRPNRQNDNERAASGRRQMGRTVHILTPNLAVYDAVSTDALGMSEALRAAGHHALVWAEDLAPELTGRARALRPGDQRRFRGTADLIIYHHSVGWPLGEAVLTLAQGPVVIRHHNVTPSRYFQRYSEAHSVAAALGEATTTRLAQRQGSWFWAASTFNCEDLVDRGAPVSRCRTLPPFHQVGSLEAEDTDVSLAVRQKKVGTTCLFVGSVKPNKGHAQAIQAFAAYHHDYNPDSQLVFAGGLDSRLAAYRAELGDWAHRLGVRGRVQFAGAVSPSLLRTHYLLADVFLCASEHEGFCVPVLEAMAFRLPVVARAAGAVPETLAGAGLQPSAFEPHAVAAALNEVVDDTAVAMSMAAKGRRRYESAYTHATIRDRLLQLVAELR